MLATESNDNLQLNYSNTFHRMYVSSKPKGFEFEDTDEPVKTTPKKRKVKSGNEFILLTR